MNISGLLIGFLMTISNLCFFSSLLTFFVMGSKVTKYKAKEKQKFEENFKEGNYTSRIENVHLLSMDCINKDFV